MTLQAGTTLQQMSSTMDPITPTRFTLKDVLLEEKYFQFCFF